MSSAFFTHVQWTPATNWITLDGADYYLPLTVVETTPIDVETAINLAIAGSGVACAWSYVLGTYTFAAAGIFALELHGHLAQLLGFSTQIWGAAAVYQSDQVPSNWFRDTFSIQSYSYEWYWRRGAAVQGDHYRAENVSGPGVRMTLDLLVDSTQLVNARAWLSDALRRRQVTFWFLPATPAAVWSYAAFYGRREHCLLTSGQIDEWRPSGRVDRLYSASLTLEVLDAT